MVFAWDERQDLDGRMLTWRCKRLWYRHIEGRLPHDLKTGVGDGIVYFGI